MTAHPNRGRTRTAASNPLPDDVRAFRRALELSAAQAAALVHTSPRAWLQWESGERRMHPAFWELARIKGLGMLEPPIVGKFIGAAAVRAAASRRPA